MNGRTGPGDPIPAVWRLPFELAWEAFRAGSRPVGAVLYDAGGRVVAAGRNRAQEAQAPRGQLAGTAIAHAEISALAQLPAGRRRDGHRLHTTLEPCLLCSGSCTATSGTSCTPPPTRCGTASRTSRPSAG
ncbi:deaminase [Streptomyces sp. NPDC001286]